MVGINPVPFRPDFYILPARYHIFGQIRNQYEIWDVKFENRTETVCPVSRSFPYSRIWSGYLIFTNSGYTVFFSSSPASFQPNSFGLDVPTSLPCPPHLSVSPSTCHRQPPLWLCPPRPRLRCPVVLGRCQPLLRLWVVVVTMYHHLSMYFYVLMLSLLDDWARSYGSVFPIYLSVDHSLSTLIRSNWFVFNIPWVCIRIPVRLIRFRYHFRIKI